MNLDFLTNVELETVSKGKSATKTTVAKNPENGAHLRVYANGNIYPSVDFAKNAHLEYQPKTEVDGKVVIVGNGLDIFSSKDWGMLSGKLPQEVIFIAAVPKTEPKVDLFASCKYEEDGTPKSSVLTQGGKTFGKGTLVPMLADIYGVNWDTTEYVDLIVVTDKIMKSHNELYAIPKVVSTGKHKGQPTYQTRQNLNICPLVIFEPSIAEGEASQPEAVISNDTEIVKQEGGNFEATAAANTEAIEHSEGSEEPIGDANPFAPQPSSPEPEPTDFSVPGVDTTDEEEVSAGDDWANGMGNFNAFGK